MNKVASMSLKWCLFDETEQTKARSMAIISSLYKAYDRKANVVRKDTQYFSVG